MRNLCGAGNYVSIPLTYFGKNFALEPLVHASAIITDENDVGEFIDKAANLKAVTTNDIIQIDRKYQTPLTFRFFGMMIQCLNEMPKIKDHSESFYRRQIFVPFTKCFTGKERKYIKNDYLQRTDVLEYVLYKAINMNHYELSEPDECKLALAEYKEYNDPIRQFITDVLDECVWDLLPFNFLYALYTKWFDKNQPSGKIQNRNKFIVELKTLIPTVTNDWYVPATPRKQYKHMSQPEPLILEYDLNDWKNPTYRGNVAERICTTKQDPDKSWKGIVRIKPGTATETDSDET